jgi:phosphohistidine phosphatase
LVSEFSNYKPFLTIYGMKKLIFVRHGKAEDPASGISDYERSLTLKGKIISRLMARKLREIEKSPFTIITSPAFRAIETALIFALEFGVEPDNIIVNSSLYYKMNLRYLPEILAQEGDNCDMVMMFGHNPSFTEIANSLSCEGCDFIPKSGVVGISFDINKWPDIRQKSGNQEFYLKPEKDL